ncbi:MAG: SRPBCC family protein [Actinobacteria bacterium]|nr:SRPBCC family protein [Actinomycetota bacterium]MBA3796275.1 SRPBCC family protein [Chloroflexota bacterium]
MAHIARTIEIDRPPEEIFDYITDLDRLTEWATMVKETRDLGERPIKQGTTFSQTVKAAGSVDIDCDWQVKQLERPRHVHYEATAPGGGEMQMSQTVTLLDGGRSRVEIDLDYEVPGGILGQIADKLVFEGQNEKEADASLANLKRILEGGESDTPRQ